MNIKKFTIKELVEELSKRESVETIIAEPYENKELNINGPAIIIKVID